MVISELQFFEIEWEFLCIDSMIFQQAFLRERPGSLNSVDVYFPIRESLSMIDSPMLEPIGDKAIITTELTPFFM